MTADSRNAVPGKVGYDAGGASGEPPVPVRDEGGLKSHLREPELWVLFVALVVYFGRLLFLSETLFIRDIHLMFLPKLQYLGDLLRAGEAPFWNWLLHGGQPFLARPQSQALYPLHLLTAIFDPVSTLNIEIFLHIALGIAGTYLLIRRIGLGRDSAFLGGAVYGFSGYLLSLTSNIFMLFSLCLMPVSVLAWHEFWLCGRRRWMVVAVAVTALQWLSGGAEVLVLSTVFLVIWGVTFPYTRPMVPRMTAFAAVQVLVVGLVAIQLIPMLHVIAGSARAEGLSFDNWSNWSVHPKRLPELLIPGFMGRTDTLAATDYWGGSLVTEGFPYVLSLYLGVLPISLALFGFASRSNPVVTRKVRVALMSLIVAFVVLALGRYLPGMRALYGLIPFAGLIRYPVKFLAITVLPIALLAAGGLHGLAEKNRRRDRLTLWIVTAAALLGGAVCLVWVWSTIGSAGFATAVEGYFGPGSAGAAAGLSAAAGRAAAVWLAGLGLITLGSGSRRRWPAYGLVLLVVADLLSAARMVNPSTSASLVIDPPPVAAYLLEGKYKGRLYRDPMPEDRVVRAPNRDIAHLVRVSREVLDSYVCWAYGIPTIFHDDYDSLASREVRQLGARMRASQWNERLPLLSASSVRWVITDRVLDLPALSFVGLIPNLSNIEFRLYENTMALPFAYVVQRAIVAGSPEAALDMVVNRDFDPGREVVLEGVVDDAPLGLRDGDAGAILQAEMAPNRWRFQVETPRGAYLVFSEIFDPGWRVWVDGREVEVLHANAAFSAVSLTPGKHVAERRYRPPGLVAGALVSTVSFVILLTWVTRRYQSSTIASLGWLSSPSAECHQVPDGAHEHATGEGRDHSQLEPEHGDEGPGDAITADTTSRVDHTGTSNRTPRTLDLVHRSEEGVEREPHGEVEDDADHGRRDPRQRGAKRPVAAQVLDIGCAEKDPQEARGEGDPGGDDRTDHAGQHRVQRAGVAVRPHETDELHDLNEGTGSGLGHSEAVQHFARLQPSVGADRLLRDVGQHCIGAAKGHHGGLAEKHSLLDEDVVRAEERRRAAASGTSHRQSQTVSTRTARPTVGRACGGGVIEIAGPAFGLRHGAEPCPRMT